MVFFCAEHGGVVRFSLRPTGTGQLSGSKENSAEYANGSLEQIYCISVSWITAEKPYNVLRFSQHVLSHQRHVLRFSQHVLIRIIQSARNFKWGGSIPEGRSPLGPEPRSGEKTRGAKRPGYPRGEAPRLPEPRSGEENSTEWAQTSATEGRAKAGAGINDNKTIILHLHMQMNVPASCFDSFEPYFAHN